MKHLLLTLFLVGFLHLQAQTPCIGGFANGYPCSGYALMSNVPLSTFNANSSSDSWGWTDPQSGKEYALIGLRNGTGFVDVSDPLNPVYLGKLPSNGLDEFRGNWRDVKVYNNYALIVSEINGHGIQFFDLTKLRNVTNPPATFSDDGVYNGFGSAHNIAINEDSGFAYGVGTGTFSGGAHFVNIQDPTNPVASGGYSTDGYTHDAQVIMYDGPDQDYQGIELYAGSNEDRVVFVDVSDKSNPQNISSLSYTNSQYTHQGWFTEDRKYFVVTDELDEVFVGINLRLIIMDVTDLDNPVVHMQYISQITSTDHNVYVKGDKIYLAAYRGGLRVLDISDIDNMNITEIGYFDTWPQDDIASASIGDPGAWNVYPFFESNNLIISNFSDNGGLFVVKDEELLATQSQELSSFKVFPNPAKNNIQLFSSKEPIVEIQIFDTTGKLLFFEEELNVQQKEFDVSSFANGIYVVRINQNTTLKIVKS